MNKAKWYIVCQHAEGYTYGVVALTDEELVGAKKMLNYNVVVGESWCGGFYICDDTPYDTEEEAINKALGMCC